MSEKKQELVAEAILGGAVDSTALKGLCTIADAVKQLGGNAELLYRDDRWLVRVFKQGKATSTPPPTTTAPSRCPYVYKKPPPPKKFLETAAKKILAENPDMAKKSKEMLKALKDAAEKKGYRRTLTSRTAAALLRRLSA